MSNEPINITEEPVEYEYMLTTIDNPYDYFTDFKNWNLFDVEMGYNTCSYLARIVDIPDDFSDSEANAEIERAIDEIIKYDFLNIYKKVRRKIENVE